MVTPPREITPGVIWWEIHDPAVRTNLSASAVLSEAGWILIDPVPCGDAASPFFDAAPGPCAILLTNGNHQRASRAFSRRWNIPVWAPAEAAMELDADHFFTASDSLPGSARPIPLPGFGTGETALAFPARNLIVIGDAIINLASHPFQFLPEKYCADHERAMRSARALAAETPDTLLFAHGPPISNNAAAALRRLCLGTAPQ